MEKGTTFHFNKLKSPSPKDVLCQVWNWLSGSGGEDLFITSMYFRYFEILSPWKRAGPFICTNLYTLYPMMLCTKFLRNWPSGSGGEDFFKIILSMYFCYFLNYLHLGKYVTLHLNKLEFPLPKNALYQVWLVLAEWFWRGRRNWKVFRQKTDNRWSEKLTWAFSSGEITKT